LRQQLERQRKRQAMLAVAAVVTATAGSAARCVLAQTTSPDARRTAPTAAAGELRPATGRAGIGEAGAAWEDMILLQAMRYLLLSSAQLQQLLPIARAANRQLSSLQLREEQVLESIRRIAIRQRDALAAGQKASLREQAEAISMRQSAQRFRSEAEESIVSMSLARLVRVLTPKQVERAFLLEQGMTPEGESREPALLDPPSGFIAGAFGGGLMPGIKGPPGVFTHSGTPGNPPNLAQQLLEAQTQLSMLQHVVAEPIPPGAVGGAIFHAGDGQPPAVFRFGNPAEAPLVDLPPGIEVMDEDAFRQRMADEARVLSGQVNDLRRRLFNPEGSVRPEQYEALLRPLARRLFLSTRFQGVLENRLRVKEAREERGSESDGN